MALTAVPVISYPRLTFPRPALGTQSSTLLDAVGEGVALVCYPPKTGAIRKIYWFVNNASNLNGTVRAGIYAVDPATGFPNTASAFGGMVAGTLAGGSLPGGAGVVTMTLSTDCTITGSDLNTAIAIVVDISARTSGGTSPRHITGGSATNSLGFPYYLQNVSAGWAKITSGGSLIAIEYSDGSAGYIPNSVNIESSETISTAGVNERGMKYVIPFACRAIGVEMMFGAAAPQDGTAVLYDSADGTLASIAIDKDVAPASWNNGPLTALFTPPVSFAAGATCRLTYLAGSASTITVDILSPPNATYAKQLVGDNYYANCFGTSRTGAGAWSDVSTVFRGFYLLLDQIDVASGGGGVILRRR